MNEKKQFEDNVKENKYFIELNKMTKKDVEVKTIDGEIIKGQLRGFQVQHMNLAIMTKDEKVIIRNWVTLRRKRETPR